MKHRYLGGGDQDGIFSGSSQAERPLPHKRKRPSEGISPEGRRTLVERLPLIPREVADQGVVHVEDVEVFDPRLDTLDERAVEQGHDLVVERSCGPRLRCLGSRLDGGDRLLGTVVVVRDDLAPTPRTLERNHAGHGGRHVL